MSKTIISIIVSAVLLVSGVVFAISQERAKSTKPTVVFEFFYGEDCPHCKRAKPFVDKLAEKYPEIKVENYEVWYNEKNRDLLHERMKEYGIAKGGVPMFFVGGEFARGFGGDTPSLLEVFIQEAIKANEDS